ncbi:MAG: heme-binding protein [Pseudomonadota bacterium]
MAYTKHTQSPLFRIVHVVLICGLIGAAVTAARAATEGEMYKGYEMPPYDVVESDGGTELRAYAPHILAEVTVRGSQSQAVSRGFQVLANYIFGGNATGQKIAMTVPVTQEPTEGASQTWTVSFMMPSSFDIATLPAARNDAVRFVETEPERLLVRGFSGFRTDKALGENASALLKAAQASGLTVTGAPRYFFYDGPMTPPWARRNEVAVPVRPLKETSS